MFNYGRHEVRSFLAVERDVLARRVSRGRPARRRGRLDALSRLRAQGRANGCRTSTAAARTWRRSASCASSTTPVYRDHPDVQTIAEESTAWPDVSRPVDVGGLGFGMKWDMGWMHDTLRLLRARPGVPQATTTTTLTFSALYAFTENFVLPLSHDEVVHGKGSLLGKMPGDEWQQLRQPAPAARLHVRASRQEAAVHGRRARRSGASGTTTRARLARSRTSRRTPACGAGCADLNALYRAEPALMAGLLRRAASNGSTRTTRDNSVLTFVRRDASGTRLVLAVVQLHAGAAPQLSSRRAARRALAKRF